MTQRVIVALIVIFVTFESQLLVIIDVVKDANGTITDCGPTPNKKHIFEVYKHLDSIIYSYLPLSIMFLCNTAIIGKLLHAKHSGSKSGASSLSKGAKRITMMLLGVSLLFVVCTMPYAVLYQVNLSYSTYSYAAIILFMYTNHSVNIIVYSVTNIQFRREFLKLLKLDRYFGGNSVQPDTVTHSTGGHPDTGMQSTGQLRDTT